MMKLGSGLRYIKVENGVCDLCMIEMAMSIVTVSIEVREGEKLIPQPLYRSYMI